MIDGPAAARRWRQIFARADWLSWRLRGLAIMALVGCVGLFVLLRAVAESPHLDLSLRANSGNRVVLVGSGDPPMHDKSLRVVRTLRADGLEALEVHPMLLQTTPRWIVGSSERQLVLTQHDKLAHLIQQPVVRVEFADGSQGDIKPTQRGLKGLGSQFWLMGALALVLYLVAAVVFFSRPDRRNALYLVMTWCLSLTFAFIALESLPGLGLPQGFIHLDLRMRTLLDLMVGAAILHVCLIHPTALGQANWLAATGWLMAGCLALGMPVAESTGWWCTQAALIAYGVGSLAALTVAYQRHAHPAALVLRRLGLAMLATLALLTLAVGVADRQAQTQYLIASIGSIVWYVFMASLLMLMPFLARSQHLMREFALLAGLSTIATSLDLLFVSAFALGQFTSLTLALFVSIGVYAGARQWAMSRLTGSGQMTAEQTFDLLYRAARAIESSPTATDDHVARLLLDLFEPLEIRAGKLSSGVSSVFGNGSALLVPVHNLPNTSVEGGSALVLRYARRGRRLFTLEDAHLADRVLAQLRSAVTFDRAVEQGRSEERMR